MTPRLAALPCIALLAFASTPAFAGGPITCKLGFNLAGWSIFYKTASGTGTVTCDNGQSMPVAHPCQGRRPHGWQVTYRKRRRRIFGRL